MVIPAPLHGPFNAENIQALIDVEQRLDDVNADARLARVGPILTRSEDIASLRIEGLVVSTRRIYEASHRPEDNDDHPVRQIVGNINIMTEALERTAQLLTHDNLHRWHRAVVEPESRSRHTIGAYRDVQNWIGGRADTPVGAEFVPPPPDLIPNHQRGSIRSSCYWPRGTKRTGRGTSGTTAHVRHGLT